MKILSADFKNNQMIPKKFTCLGEGINPNLTIEDIPQNAKTLALIVDDPDAVSKTFVHWVMFNMPITHEIKANSFLGTQGKNDAGQIGWIAATKYLHKSTHVVKIYLRTLT